MVWQRYVTATPAVLIYDSFVLHRRRDERIITNTIALNTMMQNIAILIRHIKHMICHRTGVLLVTFLFHGLRTTLPYTLPSVGLRVKLLDF